MKKLYTLVIAGLLAAQTSVAQFTMLRQHHEPVSTSGFNNADMMRYDSISAIPRGTGTGQTWDFQQMQISTTKISLSYVAPSTAPAASSFTGATLAGNHGNNVYSYYRSDSTSNPKTFQFWGMSTGSAVTMQLTDPANHLQWDITYGSNWVDSYSGTVTLPIVGSMAAAGTYSANASGLGNLILVGGKTFSNTMQIGSWDSLTVTTPTGTIRSLTRWHSYYHQTNRYPLLKFGQTSVNGSSPTYTILVNWLEAVGITDNNLEASYAIYPNPATNLVHVKLSNASSENTTIVIQSLTGTTVKRFDLGTGDIHAQLDVSDLAKGVYLVTTSTGDRTGTRKLIIE